MPRIRNTRPTNIYWLFDIRPETLIEWPNGKPFYCGKTVAEPRLRFACHRRDARKYPNRPTSQRIRECGEHVRIQIMEIVQCDGDWIEREKFWIRTLRLLWDNATNIADGGQGAPGYVPSASAIAKIVAANTGRSCSAETRNKIKAALTGRKLAPFSAERRANMSASRRTAKKRVFSDEARANMSAAHKGKKRAPFSPEHRAALSAAQQKRFQRSTTDARTI